MFIVLLFTVGHFDRNHWSAFNYVLSSAQWLGNSNYNTMSSRNTHIREEKHAQWPTEYRVLGKITKGTMGHLSIDAFVEIKVHCQTGGKVQPSNPGESYMMHKR